MVIAVLFVDIMVETGCCSSRIFEFNEDKSSGGTLFVRWCFDEWEWWVCFGVVWIEELFGLEYVVKSVKALGNDWEKR